MLLVVSVPFVAVATERSGRAIPRGTYLLWLLGAVVFFAGAQLVVDLLQPEGRGAAVFAFVFIAVLCTVVFLYNRAVVQRLRHAGHGKLLAYLGAFPFVNLALAVYLALKPGAADRLKAAGSESRPRA